MKLLIFTDHFQFGGAARVTSVFCNVLSDRQHDVLVAYDNVNYSDTYRLNPAISILPFDTKSKNTSIVSTLISLWRSIRLARKYIRKVKPDVIIAIQPIPYFYTRIAACCSKIPVIVCDHTAFERNIPGLYGFVRRKMYRFADCVSILTERDARYLGDRLPQKEVIYNPLSFEPLATTSVRRKNVLCAGRLDAWEVKGFDRMIEIWSRIHMQYPEWTLEIAGTGSDRSIEYLNMLIDKSGLADRVTLLGHVDDMKEYLSHTGIFALPSRIEGFPMVLMEAMSQGCPCVAFDIKGASREMISTPASGIVVNDDDIMAFSSALEDLMSSVERREEMSAKAIHDVARFSSDAFADKWENVLENVINKRRR